MSVQLPEAAPTVAPPSPWLTPDEAAAYLRKSPRWMRRAVDERLLPFSRVGRSPVFHVEDLNEYLRSRRVEAVAR